jgi:hypothetical protein
MVQRSVKKLCSMSGQVIELIWGNSVIQLCDKCEEKKVLILLISCISSPG